MSEDWDQEIEGGVTTMTVGPSQTGSNFWRPQEQFGANENGNGGFSQPSRGNRGYGRGRSRGSSRNDADIYHPPRYGMKEVKYRVITILSPQSSLQSVALFAHTRRTIDVFKINNEEQGECRLSTLTEILLKTQT